MVFSKKGILTGLCLGAVFLVCLSACGSPKVVGNPSQEPLLWGELDVVAEKFIKECFSDGVNACEDGEAYVAEDATSLLGLIAYKKTLKSQSDLENLVLENLEVGSTNVIGQGDHVHYDYHMEVYETYLNKDKGDQVTKTVHYRFMMERDQEGLKITHALSDDETTTRIFPQFKEDLQRLWTYDFGQYDTDIQELIMV